MRKAWWCLGAIALAGCPSPDDKDADSDIVESDEDLTGDPETDTEPPVDSVVDSDSDVDTVVDSVVETDPPDTVDSDTDTDTDTDADPLALADLALDDLRLVEVMVEPTACSAVNGQYVELVYTGDATADLAGLVVEGRNGSSPALGSLLVNPGDRVVLGRGVSLCGPSWGVTPDAQFVSITFRTTNDRVRVRQGATGRIFGELDLAGRPQTAGVAWSQDEATDARCDATSRIASSNDRGTPGAANDPCPVIDTDVETDTLIETDTPIETDTLVETDTVIVETDTVIVETDTVIVETDTVIVETDTPVETDTVIVDTDTDVPLPPLTVDELQPGDLEITEVMAWAKACSTDSRFLEIRDTTGRGVNLNGITFRSDASTGFPTQKVQSDVFLTPDGYALFLRNPTVFSACWGTPRVPTASVLVPFSSTPDRISLTRTDGTVVAEVAWPGTTGALTQGYSREKDDTGAWCDAVDQLPFKDFGSPGLANVACDARGGETDTVVVDTDTDTVETDTLVLETGVDTDTDVALPVWELAREELVITEFMPSPQACDDDDASEYVELQYRGTVEVDLYGLRLATTSRTFDMKRHLHLSPGQRVVLARSAAAFTACYGFAPDAGTGLVLGEGGESLEIRGIAPGISRLLDSMRWGAQYGASWERDDTTYLSWCTAEDPIGATTDLGTPGAVNGPCEVIGNDTARLDTGADVDLPPRTLAQHLVITEVGAKRTEPILSWIEIANPGPASVPLDGWFLAQYSNGARLGPSILKIPLDGSITLAAGESFWVGRKSRVQDWLDQFGQVPDQFDQRMSGDGDDVWVLEYDGVAVDVFGEIGVDGDGQLWDYTDRLALRHEDVRWPRMQWDPSEWTFTTDFAQSTPRVHVFSTPADPDTATPTAGAPLRMIDVGVAELLVTEFLADPAACPDAQGEFVELRWTGADDLDLRGLTLRLGVITSTLKEPFVVAPGGRVIVARDAVGFEACYGLPADLQLDIALKATGDVTQVLDNTGRVLDEVDWRTWTIAPGVAWRRDDAGVAWCAATATIGATLDKGTPGAANGTCPN